jgi:phosphoribosylformylglycinamidine synthase
VRDLVSGQLLDGVHDVSDGGLGLALAEMAVRSETGFDVEVDHGHAGLFSEAPTRVIACVSPAALAEVTARAGAAGVALRTLGMAGGDRLAIAGLVDVAVADAVVAWRGDLAAKLQLVDI